MDTLVLEMHSLFGRYLNAKIEAIDVGVPPGMVVDIEDAVRRGEVTLEEAIEVLEQLKEKALKGRALKARFPRTGFG